MKNAQQSKILLTCTGEQKLFEIFILWKKFLSKITAQGAGKNNAYSLCCIFAVFCCKFQACAQEYLKNTAHMHEIYSKAL